MLAVGIAATAVAIPGYLATVNDIRAAGAARYVSTRLQRARMEAVVRSRYVAVVFTDDGSGYAFTPYVDGDGDGVLARDIQRDVDRPIGRPERLADQFAGVDFGTIPNLPAIDASSSPPGADPIRLGSGNSASFAPNGSSTSGTLYIRGRGNVQYAVRIFGDTGKTRILKFERGVAQWKPK